MEAFYRHFSSNIVKVNFLYTLQAAIPPIRGKLATASYAGKSKKN